jgi:SRSO17 transposase
VQRQYPGAAGRIENSQVAVYLTYASSTGRALLDRALYLPKSWTQDAERRTGAGVPEDVEFATKPALAQQMLTAALGAGVPAAWVAGEEVYGRDSKLRKALCQRKIGTCSRSPSPTRSPPGSVPAGLSTWPWAYPSGPGYASQPAAARKANAGTTGPSSRPPTPPPAPAATTGCCYAAIATGELAFYRAYSPTPVPLTALVRVAGRRWTIEESFAAGKELAALDQHQVRTWTSLATLDRPDHPRPPRSCPSWPPPNPHPPAKT